MKIHSVFIFLSIVIIVIAFSLFADQPLNPDLEKILNTPEKQIPDQQNAYLALLGLEYQSGELPHIVGRAVLSNEIVSDKLSLNFEQEGDGGLCFVKGESPCNEICCWSEKRIIDTWNNNKELLQKYKTLVEYPDYQYIGKSLPFSLLHNLGTVASFNAIYLIELGEYKLALDSLIESIKFWRVINENPSTDLIWFTAHTNMYRSLNILGRLLQKMHISEDIPEIKYLLRPYSYNSALTQMLHGNLYQIAEYRKDPENLYNLRSLEEILNEEEKSKNVIDNFSKQILFKPNMTFNSLYDEYQDVILNLPDVCKHNNDVSDMPLHKHLYNSVGNLLIYNKPSQRLVRHVLIANAYLQILRSLYEMKLNGISPEELDNFKDNEVLAKEYSGQPIQWNKDLKQVGINLGYLDYCHIRVDIHEWNEQLHIE